MKPQNPDYEIEMPPVTMKLTKLAPAPAAWTQKLQIFYVIHGSCVFTVRGISYHLYERHLAFLRPMEIYTLEQGEGNMAVIQLDTELIGRYCPGFTLPAFTSMTITPEEKSAYQSVTSILKELIHTSMITYDKTIPLYHMVHGFRLLAVIIECSFLESQRVTDFTEEIPILRAIEYTHLHFREDISVQDASAIAQYSPAYFSKLFTQTTGTSYMKYVTRLRLLEAERLLEEGISIGDIAEKCGFADYRAFTRAYHQKHGVNPSSIRLLRNRTAEQSVHQNIPSDLSVEQTNLLTAFMASLPVEKELSIRQEYIDLPDISLAHFKQSTQEFAHSWQNTIGLGKASLLLRSYYQERVRELQSRIPFHRAVIHGLFDDEMQVVTVDENNHFIFRFLLVKEVFDFLLSVGLAPVVELGYMPPALAKNPKRYINHGRSCTSMPFNSEDWCNLIDRFMQFLFSIYGKERVESWEFCLWGKPDAFPLAFGEAGFQEYFGFYHCTFKTIKRASRKISFGSPAFLGYPLKTEWLDQFFDACNTYHCLPDVLRFALYPVQMPDSDFFPGKKHMIRHLTDPNAMSNALAEIQAFCRRRELPYQTIELGEWNFSISQNEYLNDTCFIAPFIVKTVLECHSMVSDMSYWACTDYLGETLLSEDTFYGGSGLFAAYGIKKPSFYAFEFLSHLGSRLLSQEEGLIITKENTDIQLLFYNYCHYSVMYAQGENFNESFSNRYDAFADQKNRHFALTLTDLPAKRYLCTSRILNRECGSAFDHWVDMGMITIVSSDEIEYLRSMSIPRMRVQIILPQNGTYHLTRELKPFEICLMELHAI